MLATIDSKRNVLAIFFINLDNWFSINIRFCKIIEIMTAIKISSFIILISSDFKLQFELKYMPSFMFNFNQIFNDFKRTSTFLLFLLFRQLLYIIALWMLMTCFKILYVWRIACLLIFLFFVSLLFDDVILVKPELEHFLQVNSNFLKYEMHFEMSLTLKHSKPLLFRVAIENLNRWHKKKNRKYNIKVTRIL